MEEVEQNLAFSFSDKDFTDFLPEKSKAQLFTRWQDFNIHDPGVTTYEALNFSFVDLTYRFDRPIKNIMQDTKINAFDSWSISDLRPIYAVTSNDYRRVLSSHNLATNSVVFPASKANVAQGKYLPKSLLNVDVASKFCRIRPIGDRELINYRAFGEYFNRQPDNKRFLRFNLVNVNVKIDVEFKQREDSEINREKLRCAIQNFLLPELMKTNFRYVENIENIVLSEYFGTQTPRNSPSVKSPKYMIAECYRKFIVVSQLIEIIEQMSFIQSVNKAEIGLLDGPYESSVLDLGHFCFTELDNFKINGKDQPASPDSALCKNEKNLMDLKTNSILGDYQDLGKFQSVQLSFPNNYRIGKNVKAQSSTVLNKTASFRTYLYFFDQIRSDILVQLGSLPKIFKVSSRAGKIQQRSIIKNPLYRDLNIKSDMRTSKVLIDELKSLEFREKRLNYLLALNGWTINEDIPIASTNEDMMRIKRQFLDLVHNEGTNYRIREIKAGKQNILFSSKSLVLLKNKIHIILRDQINTVRILEHVFLQPVWDRHESFDFNATIFLFSKKGIEKLITNDRYQKYVKQLVRSFVPAHIVVNIVWCSKKKRSIEKLDKILNAAYPPSEIFYFDKKISNEQRVAMKKLMKSWISK